MEPASNLSGAAPRPSHTQPLDALHVDGARLNMKTVVALSGSSESTVRRAVAAGELAEPIRLSARCSRFRSEDVRAWLAQDGRQ